MKLLNLKNCFREIIEQDNCTMEDVIHTTEYGSQSKRDDDSLHIASKCWERVMDAAVKVRGSQCA